MTENERRLIRTCICNGFEFQSHDREIIKIGDVKFTKTKLEELLLEVEVALDKQTAKKPIFAKEQASRYVPIYICPNCNGKFTSVISRYCYHCGQALDWSKEVEK